MIEIKNMHEMPKVIPCNQETYILYPILHGVQMIGLRAVPVMAFKVSYYPDEFDQECVSLYPVCFFGEAIDEIIYIYHGNYYRESTNEIISFDDAVSVISETLNVSLHPDFHPRAF